MKNSSAFATAALLCACLCFQAGAQQAVIIPANTAITVATRESIKTGEVKVGDPLPLVLKRPLRVDGRLIAPINTQLAATITGVKHDPFALDVAIDPLSLPGSQQALLSGNPVETKKGKFVSAPSEKTPHELDWYYRPSAGEIAALTGVGIVALPIVAIASPFLLVGAMTGDKTPKVLSPGHRAVLHTTEAVSVPVDALPTDSRAYNGLPVIYLVDRLQQHHRRVFCGDDPFWGDKHTDRAYLRMVPGTYTFHTERKEESEAVVHAKQDEEYLVYHDHAGLHAVELSSRVDLIDDLPPIAEKTVFLFDAKNITPEQQPAVDRSLAHGGCGIVKSLHARSRTVAGPNAEQVTKPADTLKP